MKKLGGFLAFLIIFSLLSLTAVQALGYPNQSVSISAHQTIAESNLVWGHHKYFDGNNYNSSNKNLYADVYFCASRYGNYVEESSRLMAPGFSFSDQATGIYDQYYYWYLALDPQGIGARGCNGWGAIFYAMMP